MTIPHRMEGLPVHNLVHVPSFSARASSESFMFQIGGMGLRLNQTSQTITILVSLCGKSQPHLKTMPYQTQDQDMTP